MFKSFDDAIAAERLSWVINERKHWENAPIMFFRAWKKAVEVAGVSNFGDGTIVNFTMARTMADLMPNIQRIEHNFETKSNAERCYLALAVSAYDSKLGRTLWTRAGIDDFSALSSLDLQRRCIIAMLLLHHTGH